MQGQTIETKVTVDATDAIAQFAKFEHETKAAEKALRDADAATKAFQKSQADAVAAVTQIDDRIARYHRDLGVLSDAITKGTGNTSAYVQQMRNLEHELDMVEGKTNHLSLASASVSKSMPQMEKATGVAAQKMLILGQFVDDAQYGLRGVVNNMPQVTQAFGGSMGLAGAVGIAAVAVSQLYDAWKYYDTVQREAAEAETVWRTALQRSLPEQEKTKDAIRSLAEEAKRFAEEVRNAGKTQYEVAIATAAAEKAQLEAKIANIEESERLRQAAVNRAQSELESARGKGDVAGMRTAQERLDEALLIQQNVRDAAKTYKGQVASIEDSVWKIADAWMAVDQTAKKTTSKKREKEASPEFQFSLGQREMIDVVGLAAQNREDMLNDIALQASQVRIGIAQQEAQSISGIVIGSLGGLDQIATGAASTVASGLQQMTTDMLTGQEHIAERFGALVMQQAGQSLVSSGTKLAGEAIVSAFTPGAQPIAAAQAGAAAGLIAAGIGLGGVATGLENIAGGGSFNKPKDKSGERDKGVAPRSSREKGGGGPLVINVSYGVGGPLPEDTAREIAKVQRQGARRGGA